METFLTSDPHFGHRNVIKYCKRPYAPVYEMESEEISMESVQRMNEDLIARWNSVVKPGDRVIVLGDFSLGKQWVTDVVPRLNGEKELIAGNHDWVHPIHYKKPEKGEKMRKLYYEAGFKSIALEGKLEIAGQTVNLHHMPYAQGGDHTEAGERFTKWRLEDNGLWLLHGHVHDAWKIKGRMINVGVDVWNYTPVHISEIEKIILEAGNGSAGA